MAEYIDRAKYRSLLQQADGKLASIELLNKMPPADVVERSKIDKVIAEISTMSHWQSDDGQDLVMVADVLEAIKRNIRE